MNDKIDFYLTEEVLALEKCPICSRKLDVSGDPDPWLLYIKCGNGCFDYEKVFSTYRIQFFNTVKGYKVRMRTLDEDTFREENNAIIHEKIDYWKENDRYLAEILSK